MTICPFATYKPVANHGGAMSAHLGLVLHVQEGNGGLQGWFNNPASGASSTWWVSKAGVLEQYVDADATAWAQGAGNATYNSVETEGFVAEPLTGAQESMLAELYAWGAVTYGWPNALAEAPGQRGLGWHGMGGSAWGGHTGCPGDLRKNRRDEILAAAFGGPSQAPDTEEGNMLASTPSGKGYVSVTRDGAVYCFGDATYLGNAMKDLPKGRAIVGVACASPDGYWLLSDGGDLYAFGAPYYGKPDRV
jgi:hypothetical protein